MQIGPFSIPDEIIVRVEDAEEDVATAFALPHSTNRSGHGLGIMWPHASKVDVEWSDGRTLHLAQDIRSLHGERGNTSAVCWRASWMLLCRYLPLSPWLSKGFQAKNILELGAGGVGLGAIALAPQAHCYYATDGDESALQALDRNLRANSATEHVQIHRLEWDTPIDRAMLRLWAEHGGVDIILAIDCVYNSFGARMLVECLERLACALPQSPLIVLAQELRDFDVQLEFEMCLTAKGFTVWRIDDPLLDSIMTGLSLILAQRKS